MDSDPLVHTVRSKRLQRFAWFTVSVVVLLIFFGGHVKSTNSGLSVPDWPNTYGHFMFSFPLDGMIGGIFWEHSHRMIASIVGLLTFALTIWVWRVDSRKWVKNLSLIASIAVLVQGLFGGLTVLFYLPTWTSTVHGALAQAYFCLLLALALVLSPRWQDNPRRLSDYRKAPIRTLALWTVGAIFIQLLLGAIMRHSEAGLVIPDFPTMYGSWVPPLSDESLAWANTELARNGILSKMRLTEVTRWEMLLHLGHRFWALVVTAMSVWTAARVFRYRPQIAVLRRPALLLLALLTVQITLGILTIYTEKQPSITTFHVVVGALTLGASLTLALQSRHLLYQPEQKSQNYPPISSEVENSEREEIAV